jgi:hypothetical protein
MRIRRRLLTFASLASLAVVSSGAVAIIVATSSGSAQPLLPPGKDPNQLLPPAAIVHSQAANGAAASTTQKSVNVPNAASLAPTPPRGIIESGLSPFPGSEYTMQNWWQDTIGGQWVQVYAGSSYSNPTDGIVVVVVSSSDWSQSTVAGVYERPQAGSLRIIAANGVILTLQSASGSNYQFDAASRKFL